uniref:Uncharacterized protein n=1 Tax=Anguilla anguilla TaxID=7936 RepID=A0A0E9W4E7_ANGAN
MDYDIVPSDMLTFSQKVRIVEYTKLYHLFFCVSEKGSF